MNEEQKNGESHLPLLRQWSMLRMIPAYPRKISTLELLQKLMEMGFSPLSLRTIQRDLVQLSEVLPLSSDENRPRGWCWGKDSAPVDIPAMNPHIALTFCLVKRFADHLLPPSTLSYLRPYWQQAEKVLQAMGNVSSVWPDKVQVISQGQPLQSPHIVPEVMEAIYTALFNNRMVQGEYCGRHDSNYKSCELHPFGLVFKGSVVYLVGSFRDYTDVRQMSLHRFRQAQVLDQPCRIPADFRLADYVAGGHFQYPDEQSATEQLVLNFTEATAYHLKETPLSEEQHWESLENGWVRIKATVAMTAQLRWWLLGFGDQVEVMAPESLRQEMAKIVHHMAQRYAHSQHQG